VATHLRVQTDPLPVCPRWPRNPPPGTYLPPANDAARCAPICAPASWLGRGVPTCRQSPPHVGERGRLCAQPRPVRARS
jgi:hypothetical protein